MLGNNIIPTANQFFVLAFCHTDSSTFSSDTKACQCQLYTHLYPTFIYGYILEPPLERPFYSYEYPQSMFLAKIEKKKIIRKISIFAAVKNLCIAWACFCDDPFSSLLPFSLVYQSVWQLVQKFCHRSFCSSLVSRLVCLRVRILDLDFCYINIPLSPRITCYRELGGSGNSEVNNGRQIRLGAVFILFYFQLTSTLENLTYRTYKV